MARTQRAAAPVPQAPPPRPGARRGPVAQAPAKPKPDDKGEHVQVLEGGDPKNAPLVPGAFADPADPSGETIQTNTMAKDNTMGEPAYTDEDLAKEGGGEVERYLVTESKMVATGQGFRTTLNVGKVVDSLNFDIALLKKQAVKMRKLAPGEMTSDGGDYLSE